MRPRVVAPHPLIAHTTLAPTRLPILKVQAMGNSLRLCLLLCIRTVWALAPSERVWAIGDLHGDVGCARHWVERTGLVGNVSAPPESWRWLEPSSQLIFMGDFIDRGPTARDVLVFVQQLTSRFPSHVHALLGNHELNLLVDRARRGGEGSRYSEYAYAAAHPAQYAAWLSDGHRDGQGDWQGDGQGDGEPADRAAVLRLLHEALTVVYDKGLHDRVKMIAPLTDPPPAHSILAYVQPPSARALVARTLNAWQAAYMRGVGSQTSLGHFVHRPLTAHLADTIFVHGGLAEDLLLTKQLPATPSAPARSLDSLEALADLNVRWLNVTRDGRVGEHAEAMGVAYEQGESAAMAQAKEQHALAESDLAELASEMVEYRGLHEHYAGRYKDKYLQSATSARQLGCERVEAVCKLLNVSRIAVGHTPEDNVRIRCGGRLLALDSTLSRSFRAHGNYYCNEAMERSVPHICPKRREKCEGQIVRLERSAADEQWKLHVVESEWDQERDEGGVVEEQKVEL